MWEKRDITSAHAMQLLSKAKEVCEIFKTIVEKKKLRSNSVYLFFIKNNEQIETMYEVERQCYPGSRVTICVYVCVCVHTSV